MIELNPEEIYENYLRKEEQQNKLSQKEIDKIEKEMLKDLLF